MPIRPFIEAKPLYEVVDTVYGPATFKPSAIDNAYLVDTLRCPRLYRTSGKDDREGLSSDGPTFETVGEPPFTVPKVNVASATVKNTQHVYGTWSFADADHPDQAHTGYPSDNWFMYHVNAEIPVGRRVGRSNNMVTVELVEKSSGVVNSVPTIGYVSDRELGIVRRDIYSGERFDILKTDETSPLFANFPVAQVSTPRGELVNAYKVTVSLLKDGSLLVTSVPDQKQMQSTPQQETIIPWEYWAWNSEITGIEMIHSIVEDGPDIGSRRTGALVLVDDYNTAHRTVRRLF